MERKLLLLGILRSQELHGYQINELIDAHLGTSIQLKKPTVYKLLGAMETDRWIRSHEEQEGNYPTRRVYRITQKGLDAFQQLLRKSLASYRPVSYLNSIGIVFLNTLPEEEAVALLRQRRKEVESLAETLRVDDQHQGGFQLMLSYHLGQLNAELEWIDEVISHLQPA
jgi:DNA-binding PadR family transcriptional regulator